MARNASGSSRESQIAPARIGLLRIDSLPLLSSTLVFLQRLLPGLDWRRLPFPGPPHPLHQARPLADAQPLSCSGTMYELIIAHRLDMHLRHILLGMLRPWVHAAQDRDAHAARNRALIHLLVDSDSMDPMLLATITALSKAYRAAFHPHHTMWLRLLARLLRLPLRVMLDYFASGVDEQAPSQRPIYPSLSPKVVALGAFSFFTRTDDNPHPAERAFWQLVLSRQPLLIPCVKALCQECDSALLGRWLNSSSRYRSAINRMTYCQSNGYDSLCLDYRFLRSLPDSIGNLSSLSRLWVSDTRLTTLPSAIGILDSLTGINLCNNHIRYLPESFGYLSHLTTMLMINNQLQALPDSIGNLSLLTFLSLGGNQLSTLPSSIGALTALTYLSVCHNRLRHLPDSIGNLQSLSQLYLSNNDLVALPDTIGKLRSLLHLDVSHNRLVTLPESVGLLDNLTSLKAHHNSLCSLPEPIGRLTTLSHLSLNDNQLQDLPESIGRLTSLSVLQISNNPLAYTPRFASLPFIVMLEHSWIFRIRRWLEGKPLVSHSAEDEVVDMTASYCRQ